MNAECRTAQVAGSLVGRGCPPTFCIAHCTQEEIAQLVGASRETVNKALAEFAHRGWIRVDVKTVWICDSNRHARRAPPS